MFVSGNIIVVTRSDANTWFKTPTLLLLVM